MLKTSVLLICIFCSGEVLAHDFWLQPSTFRAAESELIFVNLRVGEHFTGKPLPRNREHIAAFTVTCEKQSKDVSGKDGDKPAGFTLLPKPGIYVLGYLSQPSRIELPAEEFHGYLREKGLDNVIVARENAGQSAQPGRESFVRCAKAIVNAGKPTGLGYQQKLGFPLELIPTSNPANTSPKSAQRLQLLKNGKPLESALVICEKKGDNQDPVATRTDALGHVQFAIEKPGTHLFTCVSMEQMGDNEESDWKSYWASLTVHCGKD